MKTLRFLFSPMRVAVKKGKNMHGYMVYCKLPDRKRFYPLGEDTDGNYGPVANLLCASVYSVSTPEQKAELDRYVENLKSQNPECKFELRKTKDW